MKKKLSVLLAVFVISLIVFSIISGLIITTTGDTCNDSGYVVGCLPSSTLYIFGKEIVTHTTRFDQQFALETVLTSDPGLVILLVGRIFIPLIFAIISTVLFSKRFLQKL